MAKSPSRASAGKSSSPSAKKKAAATTAKSGKPIAKAKSSGPAKTPKAPKGSLAFKATAAKGPKSPKAAGGKPVAAKAAKPVATAKKGAKATTPKKASPAAPKTPIASKGSKATPTAAASKKAATVKPAAKSVGAGKASGAKAEAKVVKKAAAPAKTAAKVEKKAKSAKAAVEPKKAASKSARSGGRSRSSSKEQSNPRSVAAAAASRSEAGDSGGYMFINGRRVRMISTKGLSIPKRAKVAPVEEVAPEVEAERIRAIRTKLSEAELGKYRELLLEKRRELVGVVNVMEEEALRSSGGNLSNMPLHMADVGSDTYDQDFALGMAEAERRLLAEIDAAIGRIADRIYGVCQMTGKPIPKVRLNAKPWAKYTIEAARLVEAGQAR